MDSDEIHIISGSTLSASEAQLSSVPPTTLDTTTSGLSDAPTTTDGAEILVPGHHSAVGIEGSSHAPPPSQLSAQTEEILKKVSTDAATSPHAGTPGWEAAREQIVSEMAISDNSGTPDQEITFSKRGGKGGKRASFAGAERKLDGITSSGTPGSSVRGSTRGRPRGRGRGGARGGKRKREDRDDGNSDSSEEITSPVVSMTKSGRSVQKPTSFMSPPQPSPTVTNKRKRTYRRNPDSAVCKICLRGTSPVSNMIVFCDGCNTPYHRHCHHPPIDQSVIDEVDKEWYCKHCERERVVPVPEAEVSNFVSGKGAPSEQRQRYFASLPQGMLVTLLTKATSLHPDLPLFSPEFRARTSSDADSISLQPSANGNAHPDSTARGPASIVAPSKSVLCPNPSSITSQAMTSSALTKKPFDSELDDYPDHPPTYPRPGHGLMSTLPPEQEDLQWLVEDDTRFGVFSHVYQVDANAAESGLKGNIA